MKFKINVESLGAELRKCLERLEQVSNPNLLTPSWPFSLPETLPIREFIEADEMESGSRLRFFFLGGGGLPISNGFMPLIRGSNESFLRRSFLEVLYLWIPYSGFD